MARCDAGCRMTSGARALMHYWTAEQLRAVQAAVDSARGGAATVLSIEGRAGTGKSSLLVDLRDRADGFVVRTAFGGLDTVPMPFGLLAQWGVDPAQRSLDASSSPFAVAQRLREFVDGQVDRRPLLLCVDDLHLADPESVESLVWLLRRSTGERLLVAAVHRPLPPARFPQWRAPISSPGPAPPPTPPGLNGLALPHPRPLRHEPPPRPS